MPVESLYPFVLRETKCVLLDLYAPLCGAHAGRPLTIAHLGQSLDGFIATASGDSYYVTGPDNVRHLHRLRALSSAIVIGERLRMKNDHGLKPTIGVVSKVPRTTPPGPASNRPTAGSSSVSNCTAQRPAID